MQDNRKFERFALSVKVEVTFSDGGKTIVDIKDVSSGGVFLHMPGKPMPPLGSELLLKLAGLADIDESSTVRARVVRITDEGAGVEFLDR